MTVKKFWKEGKEILEKDYPSEGAMILDSDSMTIEQSLTKEEIIEKFEYEGYMSTEAQQFFEGFVIREERDGCATVGHFIKLHDGTTILPSKGDKFTKEGIKMFVESKYRK